MNVLPERGGSGDVVTHLVPSNVVDAWVAAVLKFTTPSGTLIVKADDVIVCPVKLRLKSLDGTEPLSLNTAVNQIVLPAAIFVPLKFDAMEELVPQVVSDGAEAVTVRADAP